MKRALLAIAALLPAACTNRTLPPPITIVGVNDVALLTSQNDGGLLFLTSTDQNELRVLDLSLPIRDFVRAPNPIQPLSIPVLDRPVEIARDVAYVDGAEVDGPYVYARAAAAPFFSIVGGTQNELLELGALADAGVPNTVTRFQTNGVVTALAGMGPAGRGGAGSTLFYADTDGSRAGLYEVALGTPNQILSCASMAACPAVVQTQLGTLDGETVSSLLVMPPFVCKSDPCIAVATRTASGGGRAFLLEVSTLLSTPLHFPAPVRQLMTHPAYTRQADNSVVPAGANIFGVLDESSCGNQSACNGVVAVSSSTGHIALDSTGNPMLTLSVGNALVQGLTLSPGPFVNLPLSVGLTSTQIDLLGVITSSDGLIYFFDADQLRFFNGTGIDFASATGLTYATPDGGAIPIDPGTGPQNIQVATGATQTETISITYNGVLAVEPSATLGDGGLMLSQAATVLPGDLADVSNGTGCDGGEFPITSVGGPTFVTLGDVDGGLAACGNGAVSVILRAGGTQPYTVAGTTSGLMGRTGATGNGPDGGCAGPPFQFAGSYYWRPAGYTGAPALSFCFQNDAPPPNNPVAGATYTFNTASNYFPLDISISPTVGLGFQVPGSAVFFNNPAFLEKLYVAYPGANAVLEIDVASMSPNQPNQLNLQAYR